MQNENLYVIKFQAEIEGVLAGPYDDAETLARFEAGLLQTYGPDGYSIIDFRPMTDEEKSQYGADVPAEDVSETPETIH